MLGNRVYNMGKHLVMVIWAEMNRSRDDKLQHRLSIIQVDKRGGMDDTVG